MPAPNECLFLAPLRPPAEPYAPVPGNDRSGALIGIGGRLTAPPSPTTGHTGPYHGGSIGLSLSRDMEAGKTEAVEKRVAQGLLDRRMS
jgi:hypothetical protein